MTDNSEGSEPIKLIDDMKRIQKDAFIAYPNRANNGLAFPEYNAKERFAYIAGATAEHKLLKPQLEYADSTIKKLHEAMVSAERRGHDRAMEEMKARDENAENLLVEMSVTMNNMSRAYDQKDERLMKFTMDKVYELSHKGIGHLMELDRLTDQLKQRDETIKELREALKEVTAELSFITNDQAKGGNVSYGPTWIKEWSAIISKASKLIED